MSDVKFDGALAKEELSVLRAEILDNKIDAMFASIDGNPIDCFTLDDQMVAIKTITDRCDVGDIVGLSWVATRDARKIRDAVRLGLGLPKWRLVVRADTRVAPVEVESTTINAATAAERRRCLAIVAAIEGKRDHGAGINACRDIAEAIKAGK